MKGIILAGGTGSRLNPLTLATNKHLLPVGMKPMIFHAIDKLIEVNIRSIMIVTGIESAGNIVQCLGSGRKFGAEFTYRVQDEAGGIAQALGLCREFCYGERFVVILGDNIFEDGLKDYVDLYNEQSRGAMVLLKEVNDPQRFGVAEVHDDGRIVSIEEKPKDPRSNYAVTGIYFYDQRAFNIIDELKPSRRNELEISDVNNTYIEWGELKYAFFNGWWSDAGTPESYVLANKLVLGR